MAKKNKPGPLKNKENIPYDYIVIVDAGSKGSRVFVYNWPNPQIALQNGYNLNQLASFKDFKLVRREDVPAASDKDSNTSEEDDESDDEDDDNQKSSNKKVPVQLPKITGKKKWKTKIKPGISTFSKSPQKIGNHHLKHLLRLASQIVPKSQHSRTPIFLHSTAGMRLLTPAEQQKILNNVCEYFRTQSDFFLPDCPSHINVIEGDVEGIYGWLAINYLVGSFDNPMSHQHGKNHTTYGLLDMGGASTQVVFQPNTTEIDEHENNLYNINLFELPQLQTPESTTKYSTPDPLTFNVYSDSFLGLGMSQAYNKYLNSLIENNEEDSSLFYNPPISDPCLPKGYRAVSSVNGVNHDFTGSSDFEKCLTSIFPVLSQSTYGVASDASGNCKQYNDEIKVSSCLLNDLIPAFDFDINHFYGVSGYWYAISNLMAYNEAPHLEKRKKSQKDSDYDYKIIYDNTQKLCSKSYSELIELNELKPKKHQLSSEELTNLCFKSSWILNFLHLGLGFPRFGIDDVDQKQQDKFKSLQLVDKVNGAEFSWTLGRALLYANDEYIQAYENYSSPEINAKSKRAGFTFSVSPNAFHYGAEQSGVQQRPAFTAEDPHATYHYFDYEKGDGNYEESKWYIEPHRWYGVIIFACLLSFILWLLLGSQGRLKIQSWFKDSLNRVRMMLNRGNTRYIQVNVLEQGSQSNLELEDLGQSEDKSSGAEEVRN